ncbi:hypothetical protein ACFVYP_33310 [Kitasatospora sp. NPDC058201]|uniref:hypothetical protein n=1 Tax=unclassified Kitasatospora TaxID=2633591 RepID=UPI0036472BE8
MAQVSEVAAGELDPSWLGGAFEVVEEGPDGPLVHGMRLVSYRKVVGREKVVLVGESTSVVVGAEVGLAFHVAAAVPGRFTGAVVDGGVAGPAQPAAVGQPVPAVGWPGAGGYPPPGPVQAPGPVGPGPGVPPPGPGAAAPWMRRPPQG